MSIGLIALLDDVTALAKVAAASLDDVAGQAGRAGMKAAGVVIDDAAVAPRFVAGIAASRELPIVGRIAAGSLRNKLVFLLPAALLLSAFAPQVITPLLMLGGFYLCYEGAEKVHEALLHREPPPEPAQAHPAAAGARAEGTRAAEDEKVAGAVRTDFILSAEIMAITLAAVPEGTFWSQAFVLAVVGIGITAAVYGVVALVVKADDIGLVLASSESRGWTGTFARAAGHGLVRGMPALLKILGVVGTAAMIWVGGGILVHGAENFGLTWPAHTLGEAAEAVAHRVPSWLSGLAHWAVEAAGSGLVGIVVGAALLPVAGLLGRAARGAGRLWRGA
ncbi:MAG: DUF808 domain-containing protein [Actinomycetospora chiangmaiensis]|nr:DUF808 domain-containing protein [Actinomycetospora chiangmaiensis]